MSYQAVNSLDTSTSSTSLLTSGYSSRKEKVLWKGRKCAYCVSILLGSLAVAGVTAIVFCALDPSGEVRLPYWMLGVISIAITIIGYLGACCLYCYVPSNNNAYKVRAIDDQRRGEEQARRELIEEGRGYREEIGQENEEGRQLDQEREDAAQERRNIQDQTRDQNGIARGFQEGTSESLQNCIAAAKRMNALYGDGSDLENAGD